MQSVSSRIWTRVAVSNSYDDNHYTIIEIDGKKEWKEIIPSIMVIVYVL